MTLRAFLRRVVDILDDAQVPWMLTGSVAAAYYATPRATQDIDVVVDPGEAALNRVVDGFVEADFYVDRDAALDALRSRGQFNAIDPDSGWKVDLLIRKDRPFSGTEFERRGDATLLGVEVKLASLEDVLLSKLEWAKLADSELQRRDVAQLLERAYDRLDLEYVERWVGGLGLEAEWERVRPEPGDPEESG